MEKHLMIRSAHPSRVSAHAGKCARPRLSTSVETTYAEASAHGDPAHLCREPAYILSMRRRLRIALISCLRLPLRLRLALALALSMSVVHVAGAATAPKDRRYVNARNGISVEAPTGWALSTHTGFPSILVLLIHPDGSRISIAVSESQAASPHDLAESNRKGLEAQALKIIGVRAGARDGVEVEAQSAARAESVIQLYLLRETTARGPRQAIVITMVTPTPSLVVHRPAFDYVVGKLSLSPLPEPPGRSPPPKTGSAAERPAEEPRR
jgi:hypothetical protein